MKPEPPEPRGNAAQWPWVPCPVGDTDSRCWRGWEPSVALRSLGCRGGCVVPPRSSPGTGSAGGRPRWAEPSAGTRGSLWFFPPRRCRSRPPLSCCSAGRAGGSRPGKAGARGSRGFADAPGEPPTACCYLLGVFSRRCHTSRGHWGHRVLLSLAAFRRLTEGITQTLICPEVQIRNSSREDSVSLSLCLSFSLSPVQTITRPDFHHLGI